MIHTQDADFTLYLGDVMAELAGLPDESVHCVVTSPPFWGLRDYGTGRWDGGQPDCEHEGDARYYTEQTAADSSAGAFSEPGEANKERLKKGRWREHGSCVKCGARRVDQQLGLEPTPDLYVARMVEVFREVRRVLRADGTCWVNLGDSYAGSPAGNTGDRYLADGGAFRGDKPFDSSKGTGLKPKDLCGIPWAVAKALQSDYYTGRIAAERDRVWMAATIDGEGTICGTVHKRKDDGRIRTMPSVFVTNSSQAMLNEAQRIWPTSQTRHSRPGDGHLGTVDVYRWIVHGVENKTMLLRELYPYLIVKKKQALLAYNLLVMQADAKRLGKSALAQEVRDKREHLCQLISRLNHAQDVDPPSWCMPPEGMWERGWYLRSDIIWAKPNPMPESVTDRPTKSHEYVFLLTKSPRYFFDQEAVREPNNPATVAHIDRYGGRDGINPKGNPHRMDNGGGDHQGGVGYHPAGRNVRSVWDIATQPYPEAHFATYPEELVRRCVLAGSSERGCCPVCGKPWEREVETTYVPHGESAKSGGDFAGGERTAGDLSHGKFRPQEMKHGRATRVDTTLGWRPGCDCPCPDCGLQYVHDADMPALPGTVHEETEPSAVLLAEVRESGRSSETAEAVADDEGLHLPVRTGASGSVETGPGDGASDRDGDETGPPAASGRGSASLERREGRQPPGESGSDAEADTRPQAEETGAADPVSALRRADSGTEPTVRGCRCRAERPVAPCVVLDPFLGSGTTAYVARKHGRRSIGIELNPAYADLAARRMAQQSLEFAL